ncbi:hypothetical protein AB0N81_40365 [Streptomyces sp. NPDC093510]|uniref:hypothetical protein n=1 Tax=Streptomyces sp. NPDC093510 TaxID=3155199 RepID=UPI0034395BBD
MTASTVTVLLAEGRVSSDPSLHTLIFCLLFGTVGVILATDFRGAAHYFVDFVSRTVFGGRGAATPRVARVSGLVIAVICVAGLIAETSLLFR